MPSDVVLVADAVAAALRAAALSLPVEVERLYVPVYEVKDLVGLRLTVVPSGRTTTAIARGATSAEIVIDVGVHKHVGRGGMTPLEHREACDPLMALVQEIGELFLARSLAGLSGAHCSSVEDALLYEPSLLRETKVFLAVVKLTFRVL